MNILNRMQTSAIDILAASLIAALVFVAPAPLCAQQPTRHSAAPQSAVKAAPEAEEEDEAPAPKKPGQEGIKIHGHWIIDVKNADGSVAEHRDFQNSLNGDGPYQLSRTLLGMFTPEYFSMYLYTSGSSIYQLSVSGSVLARSACYTAGGYICSTGLAQGLTPYSGGNVYAQNTILLSAQVTPASAVTINQVGTALSYCADSNSAISTLAPTTCKSGTVPSGVQYSTSNFTGTTLSSPLSVAAGQSVYVTVTFSFS